MTNQQLIDIHNLQNEACMLDLEDQLDNFLGDFVFHETEKTNPSFHAEINDIDDVIMHDEYFDERDLDVNIIETFLGDRSVMDETSAPYPSTSVQGCSPLQQDIDRKQKSTEEPFLGRNGNYGGLFDLPCHPSMRDQYTSIRVSDFEHHGHDKTPCYRQQMMGPQCQFDSTLSLGIHSGMQHENEPMAVSMEDRSYIQSTFDHPISNGYRVKRLSVGNGWIKADRCSQEERVAPDIAPFEHPIGAGTPSCPQHPFMDGKEAEFPSFCPPMPSTPDPNQVIKRLEKSMSESATTMAALQEWDKKHGLPKSHSPTMVHSSRSRKQLQKRIILRKWNGDPLIKPISNSDQPKR